MGGFLVVIPAAGLLDDLFPLLDQFDLAGALAFDGSRNRLERVQVLHLGTCSKLSGSRLPDGQVDIGTHGTFV